MNNIIDLLVYLQEKAVDDILKDKDPHEKFMTQRKLDGKTFTRQEIADHIRDNTELGMDFMRGFVLIAIELFDKKKREMPNELNLERHEL